MRRNLTSAANVLRQAIQAHREWLLDTNGRTFYLLSNEISVAVSVEGLRIRYLDDLGFRSHVVSQVGFEDGCVSLEFCVGANGSSANAKLVPRVNALDLKESVELARMEVANDLSGKLSEQIRGFKPLRVALNDHNGRFAEILAQKGRRNLAVLADVSGVLTHEAILSKAFIWLRKLSARKKQRIETIWIVADRKSEAPLRALIACLKSNSALRLWKPARSNRSLPYTAEIYFEECPPRKIASLWSGRLARLSLFREKRPTAFASGLLVDHPFDIDRVFSAKGETLRYKGLPFARTRILGGEEKAWIGVEQDKIPLTPESAGEFEELIGNLKLYRRHDSPNKQHEYYSSVPEAWLESILRRNIKALDANLILSPIYNQFRAAREKIDLLALRRDGRLVIIELKIAPDRDMVFQAVDYWRKVESQRRRGILNKERLFGDKEIADRPTAIYLVAPTLGFHVDTEFLAEKVSNQIEMYRFDLAENWRQQVTVLRRRRIGEIEV